MKKITVVVVIFKREFHCLSTFFLNDLINRKKKKKNAHITYTHKLPPSFSSFFCPFKNRRYEKKDVINILKSKNAMNPVSAKITRTGENVEK